MGKIDLIKMVKSCSSFGLKEAKFAVEEYLAKEMNLNYEHEHALHILETLLNSVVEPDLTTIKRIIVHRLHLEYVQT